VRPIAARVVLSWVLVLAACVAPAPPPTRTPSLSESAPAESPTPVAAAYHLACLSVPQPECETIAAAVARRFDAPGDIVAIEIQAFPCEGVGCPAGFLARSRGEAVVELVSPARIESLSIAVTGGAMTFGPAVDETVATLVARSAHAGRGVLRFTLGHCGLLSPIDVDGSLWDPIGQIDGDAAEAINVSAGSILLLAPRAARFVADPTFSADLVRRDGRKSYRLCA
jgi:hypothetical protein